MGGTHRRVLLGDDNEAFRCSLRTLLQAAPDFELVGEAEDGEGVVRLARELRPDVVVVDIVMPRMNGIEATRRIRTEFPTMRVIALSIHGDAQFVRAMRDAGASAYVLKDNIFPDLLEALRAND